MTRKDTKNMVDVMDRLTGEHKDIPTYVENLYKWTPEPSILKQDVCWDALTLEDLKCPYCNDETGDCLIDSSSILCYVFGNRLWIELLKPHDLDAVFSDINYCPMCGRSLK